MAYLLSARRKRPYRAMQSVTRQVTTCPIFVMVRLSNTAWYLPL